MGEPLSRTEAEVRAGHGLATAKAAKAAADARAAEAAAAKAEAEARSAVAKAELDERANAEAVSELGRQAQDAASRQKIAEADRAATAARRDRAAGWIPDLTEVDRGTLDTSKADAPLFASALNARALEGAALQVAASVQGTLDAQARLLVTSDAALTESHAAYVEVMSGLERLSGAASALVSELDAAEGQPPASDAARLRFLAVPAVVVAAAEAAASALPGVLSLFTAHRTVTSWATTVDDLAATAAVAGALAGHVQVVHDDVRLVRKGVVHEAVTTVGTHRQALVARKLVFEDLKSLASAEMTAAVAARTVAETAYAASPGDRGLGADVERATAEAGRRQQAITDAATRLGLVDGMLSTIDAFLSSLSGADGATTSLLTLAAMRAGLEPGQEGGFTHVLLVKGFGGSTAQLFDDRTFRPDRFAVGGSAGITFVLLDTESTVLAAGNAPGAASVTGKLKSEFMDLRLSSLEF